MKFTLATIAVFASLIAALHAQTVVKEAVVKIPSTNALTESIVIPSGLSLTINSGATITNNGTATGFGSGGAWGSITGTLSAQADLQLALDQKLSTSTASTTYAPIASPTFTGRVTVPGTDGFRINAGSGIGSFEFYGTSAFNKLTVRAAAISGANTITVPNVTGALISTADTGTVTSAMLAGSIDPSKVTGTAAILGANTFTSAQIVSVNAAASTPPVLISGSVFTGGSATTTKPSFLVEPSGTTSTGWGTSGTLIGANAPTGFAGNLIDLQVAGTQRVGYDATTSYLRVKVSDTNAEWGGAGGGIMSWRLYGQTDMSLASGAILALPKTTGAIRFNGDTGVIRSSAGIVGIRNGSTGGGTVEMIEVTAPGAGASNTARIYVEDNGAGKTRLMVIFPSGAAQQIAIEP